MTILRRPRTGFTLIELLVVIAIISLLISILLPAMSGSRKTAKKTECLSRLRSLYVAHAEYINSDGSFPPLNNMPEDGTWQYNYLIWDGMDFGNNFGPIIQYGGMKEDITFLYCPVQRDEFHMESTAENPWPPRAGLDARSGYARRNHVSGKSLSQLKTVALLSDLIHLPGVVKRAHGTGVNAAYTDGHAKWVPDPGIFTDNSLTKPFDPLGNDIIEDIWDAMDEAP